MDERIETQVARVSKPDGGWARALFDLETSTRVRKAVGVSRDEALC